MIRRWLNVCALVSLPLFAGTLACSVAGRVLPGGCGTSWKGEEILYFVDANDGFVQFMFGTEFEAGKQFHYPGARSSTDQRFEAATQLPEVYVGRSHRADVPWRSGRVEYYWVRIHQFYLFAATGAPLALWLAARRMRRPGRPRPV